MQSSFAVDSSYGMSNGLDSARYGGYGYENGRLSSANSTTGSTALYHHNGSRYGLGLNGARPAGADSKMNGLHGPKHKRGDIDRECKPPVSLHTFLADIFE